MQTLISVAAAAVLGLSLAACGAERDEPIEEEAEGFGDGVADGADELAEDLEAAGDDATDGVRAFGERVEDEVDPD